MRIKSWYEAVKKKNNKRADIYMNERMNKKEKEKMIYESENKNDILKMEMARARALLHLLRTKRRGIASVH